MEYLVSSAPHQDFVGALEAARTGKYGGFLAPTTTDALMDNQALTFLSHDSKIGYAITRDGDVRHAFNTSRRRGAGTKILSHAKAQGGKTLDAYDGFLVKLYRKNGFEETSRMGWDDAYAPEDWNYDRFGQPDVVNMEYTGPMGDAKEAVVRKPRKRKKAGGLRK